MAFNYRNWGVISTSGSTQSTTLQDGSVIGAPGMYTYQSATETLLDISSVDYFSPVGNTVSVGDFIYVQASDAAGLFHILAVDFETGNLIIALLEGGGGGGITGPLTSTPNSPALWNSIDGSSVKDGAPWLFSGADLTGGTNINVVGYMQSVLMTVKDTTSENIVGWSAPALSDTSLYFVPAAFPSSDFRYFMNCDATGHQSWAIPGAFTGDNTFLGASTGNLTLTGTDNNCVGFSCGIALTSGSFNTLLGQHCGEAIQDGSFNVGIGLNVFGGSSTHGLSITQNTAVGANAMGSNLLDADACCAFGFESLQRLHDGSGNNCFGWRSGYQFTGSESGNICLGSEGITGSNNTIFIGEFGSHNKAYIAGILGNTASSPRMVTIDNSTGQMCEQPIPSSASFTPVPVSGTTQALLNLGSYYINSGVQTACTLPLSPSLGDQYRITIVNGTSSSFKVTPGATQTIQYSGGVTTPSTGYVTSVGEFGSITLECIQTSPDIFNVLAPTVALDVV